MPFTLSHGAAALPFRRFRLVASAVLVGTFAPDFEYFLRFGPRGHFGHTPVGIFTFTLPAALVVLWLFHTYVKWPVARLLPEAVQRRLASQLQSFRFGGAARLALIAGSVLLGVATHVFWDAFTHAGTWPYRHWAVLRQWVELPVVGPYPFDRVLQQLSTLVGMGVLAIWIVQWYRSAAPSAQALASPLSTGSRMATWLVVIAAAAAGATLRASVGSGISAHHLPSKGFIAQWVVTFIALLWWELVLYGFWRSTREA